MNKTISIALIALIFENHTIVAMKALVLKQDEISKIELEQAGSAQGSPQNDPDRARIEDEFGAWMTAEVNGLPYNQWIAANQLLYLASETDQAIETATKPDIKKKYAEIFMEKTESLRSNPSNIVGSTPFYLAKINKHLMPAATTIKEQVARDFTAWKSNSAYLRGSNNSRVEYLADQALAKINATADNALQKEYATQFFQKADYVIMSEDLLPATKQKREELQRINQSL